MSRTQNYMSQLSLTIHIIYTISGGISNTNISPERVGAIQVNKYHIIYDIYNIIQVNKYQNSIEKYN